MIVLTAALLLAPVQLPTASETVSKMLTKYHEAQTITGKVTFSQSAGNVKVVITSDILTKKPNLFSIQQTRTPASQGGANSFLAVGDGKKIGYPAPAGSATFLSQTPERFFEAAKSDLEGNFKAFNGMLLDRSLGVAIGLYSPEEIYLTIGRLRDLKISEVAVGETSVYRIDFQLVVANALPASDGFPARPEVKIPGVMTISKNHDFLGMAWREKVGNKEQAVEVLSEWTAALEVGKPIDPSVFRVR